MFAYILQSGSKIPYIFKNSQPKLFIIYFITINHVLDHHYVNLGYHLFYTSKRPL